MAVASSGSIWPLNISLPSSKIKKPFIPAHTSHLLCKNSHRNGVAIYPSTVADGVLMDIRSSGIIACLRAESAEVAIDAARAALRGGILVLEVTMSTPGVFEVLQCLVQEYPSTSIGVGTVLHREDAKNALKIGAKFLMSPVMVKDILDDVAEGQALYIPGAMTPTEILFAFNAGAKIIKVYPVSALGGAAYIAAIKKPFPHIPLVASQGITIDSVGQYINSGASSLVLSDAIFEKKAMAQRNFNCIKELASFAASNAEEALR